MGKRIVIALGGNALGESLSGQMAAVRKTSKKILELARAGYEIVLTHGNGPQVGLMTDCFDSYKIDHDIEHFTMSLCVSITQGYIGYDLQNVMRETLLDAGLQIPVSTVITQVIVDKNDPAFANPTKPIGLFLTEEQAEKRRQMGEDIAYIDKRGYRQVVASPMPQHIVETQSILALLAAGQIVIACGGGGIPVIEIGNRLKGVEAIIDKDFSSAILAKLIGADYFAILTSVEQVSLNYGGKNEKLIGKMSVAQAKEYARQGQFGQGSMLPKVMAAVQVKEQMPSCRVLITSLEKLLEGLHGQTGTTITG